MQLKNTLSHLSKFAEKAQNNDEALLNFQVIKNFVMTTPSISKFDLSNVEDEETYYKRF